LVDPDDLVVTKRACPEKIGIAWKARGGMKHVYFMDGGIHNYSMPLRIRKSHYDFIEGNPTPKGLLVELEIDEALKTGLNIDEWSSE